MERPSPKFFPETLRPHVGRLYALLQTDELRHVVVIGSEFRGAKTPGPWRRFRSPQFGTVETIAPGDVRALAKWAVAPDPLPQEVDWTGRPINTVAALGRNPATPGS